MITVHLIAYYIQEKIFPRKPRKRRMSCVEDLQERCAALDLDFPRAVGESLGRTLPSTPKFFICTCPMPDCELRHFIGEGSPTGNLHVIF